MQSVSLKSRNGNQEEFKAEVCHFCAAYITKFVPFGIKATNVVFLTDEVSLWSHCMFVVACAKSEYIAIERHVIYFLSVY